MRRWLTAENGAKKAKVHWQSLSLFALKMIWALLVAATILSFTIALLLCANESDVVSIHVRYRVPVWAKYMPYGRIHR